MSKTLLAPVSESLGLFFFTMNQQLITRINGIDIISVDREGEIFVPIKPICQALGIDAVPQRDKLQNDELFNSVGMIIVSTGADGKNNKILGSTIVLSTMVASDDKSELYIKVKS